MIVYEKQSTGFIMYGFSMIICMKDTHYKTRRRFITGVGATGAVALAGCTDSNDSGSSGATAGSGSESMADEIVFYNSGSLEFDPGTETNIERFEEETGISVEVNEVPWSNLKPASPRSGGTRTTRSTRSTVRRGGSPTSSAPDGSNRSDSAMTTCLSSRIQYFTKPLS